MPIHNVSNVSQLATALASAQAGDRIVLAAGNYGDLKLNNRAYSGTVEIVSADAANPGQFRTVFLTGVTNLTFKSIEIGYTLAPGEPTWAKYANLDRTSNITFDDVHFRGSLDGDSSNDGNALSVANSDHIRVINSEFQQLNRGVVIGSSTDVEVLDNNFHDMRSDGADFADVQRVLIARNHFTNFTPVGDDHPDAIQFWTYGTSRASSDIVIHDNIVLQGSGRGLQGIFLKDEVGSLPYERVQIYNNLVYVNDGLNGITIQGGRGAVIQNNTVVSQRGDAYNHYIRMEDVNGLVLKDNVSDTFVNVRNSNLQLINNVRFDQSPARAIELRDLQAGAGATVEGLTMTQGGYRPEGAPPPLKPPRIGDNGDSAVYLGATLGASDYIDLLGGTDAIGLQGDYSGFTLGAHNLQGVEHLALISGRTRTYGDSGANLYSYDITVVDQNVAAGARLTINAYSLQPGERFAFNGSAETDGSFFIYGGRGENRLTGSAGNDVFYMGDDTYKTGDRLDGGAGIDTLVLRGNYDGAKAIVLAGDSLRGVEHVSLTAAADTRYLSGGAQFSYDIMAHDEALAAGQVMNYNGFKLAANETFTFDGSAETDGSFRLYGGAGADSLTGGAGNDIITGGLGKDRLAGGNGADTFVFKAPADSSGLGCDQLIGFDCRIDKLDLPGSVNGIAEVVGAGTLSLTTFDGDLAAALNSFLGKGEAALFTASAGDMTGRTFLVVDANNQDGYQAGDDFVIEIVSPVVPINPAIDFFV